MKFYLKKKKSLVSKTKDSEAHHRRLSVAKVLDLA
jgi:hypothetical protein